MSNSSPSRANAAPKTSGQAIVDALIRNGVSTVFGIPGVHTYLLFEALHERKGEIRFIGTRHEQGAAYMAYGYAQASGKTGTYTCVPGPGVLNTTAALCTAFAANAPVMCVTSEIPSNEIGQGHGILHELPDQLATLKTLTKWAGRINHPTEAYTTMDEAFRQMTSGRPGPVAIECPWDTLGQEAQVVPLSASEPLAPPPPDASGIEKAADLIAKAKKPFIMLGSGAVAAGDEVRALAELLQAPVTSHRSGRGIVGDEEPYGLNFAAAYGLWKEADLLIAVGTRMELQFLRWRHIPEGLKIVRIDIDPREMTRRKADIGLVCDAKEGLNALLRALSGRIMPRPSRVPEFAAQRAKTRKAYEGVQPQISYLDVIRDVLPRDGILVEEICQVGFTARFGFPVNTPRSYISCAYQDNLGFGYMTALGVKVAKPDLPVISISGDGGFMFGVQELATAVQHGINVVAIVFNNSSFGNVLRDQNVSFAGHVIGAELRNPDFTALAKAFGAKSWRLESPDALRPALEEALHANAPCLIEVMGDPGGETSPWPFIHPFAFGL